MSSGITQVNRTIWIARRDILWQSLAKGAGKETVLTKPIQGDPVKVGRAVIRFTACGSFPLERSRFKEDFKLMKVSGKVAEDADAVISP